MHYIVCLGETDITLEWLLRTLHSTPLALPKQELSDKKLCTCMNYTFPVIREIKLYEIDVLDPAAHALETELAKLGIGGKKLPFLVKKPLMAMIGGFGIKGSEKWEDAEIPNVQGRLNSRSFILAKKADNEAIEQNPLYVCQKCAGKFPQNWA